MAAIGIDFGTSNSRVAVVRNGKVEVLENNQGKRSTPSVVAFTENERFIGDEAVKYLEQDPENTIYNVKSLMGRSIQEIKDSKTNFTVKADENKKANIKVSYKKEEKSFLPEEICAMLLRKMKSIAEEKLKEPVQTVVIGVPAHFNDVERRAVVDAGKIAGFSSPVLINETTASLLAMEPEQKSRERTVMIFDLGGGNLQASIAEINEGHIRVKAFVGFDTFAGESFTKCMVEHFISTRTDEEKTAIEHNQRALGRLRANCEVMKKNMPLISSGRMDLPLRIQIPKLLPGMDFTDSMSRRKFEDISSSSFEAIFNTVEGLLTEAHIDKDKLSEVVVVGCATPTPRISEELENFFGKNKIRRTLNVEEAVARGAAVYAALLKKENLNHIRQLEEIMYFPILLKCRRNAVNTSPWIKYPMFPACHNIKNTILLSLHINGNGIVGISAEEKHAANPFVLRGFGGNYNEEVLTEKRTRAEKYDKLDEHWRNTLQEDNDFESLCYKAKKSASRWKDSSRKTDALEKCRNIRQWIEDNRNNVSEDMKTEKEKYTRDLENIINFETDDKKSSRMQNSSEAMNPPPIPTRTRKFLKNTALDSVVDQQPSRNKSLSRTTTPTGNADEPPEKRTAHSVIEEQPRDANVQIQESNPKDVVQAIDPLQPSINGISDHSESSGPTDNRNDDETVHGIKESVNEDSSLSEQQKRDPDYALYYPGSVQPHKREEAELKGISKPAKEEETASNATLDTNSQDPLKDELPGSKSDDHQRANGEMNEIQQMQNIQQCDGEYEKPVENQSYPQKTECAKSMDVAPKKQGDEILISHNHINKNILTQYANEMKMDEGNSRANDAYVETSNADFKPTATFDRCRRRSLDYEDDQAMSVTHASDCYAIRGRSCMPVDSTIHSDGEEEQEEEEEDANAQWQVSSASDISRLSAETAHLSTFC